MADLETLTIQINAESQRATDAIGKLARRLDGLATSVAKIETGRLNDLAHGLDNLNSVIYNMNATSSKWDYKRIVTNINVLTTANLSGLDSLTTSLGSLTGAITGLSNVSASTDNVKNLILAIGKLGSKSVDKAITNIPKLEKSLSHLLRTISKVPNINQSVIEFVNSLTNLASQGTKIGTASNSIKNSLERFGTSATRATRKSLSLASAIGTLYAKFWLLMRLVRGLKSAFKDAADYLEAYNFFEVVAGKIGADTFRREGINSADEYAEAFMSEMKKKLHQMSGLELDLEDRLIKTTNAKSLGLNLTEITQYQASLASLTNAMHLTQEVSTATSKALSMLAADMGSLRNVDYEQIASNLQSGLTGQARALYKYGIDITQATLEQYAFNEGLTKSVSEMTQAEKAQLRLLAILDQSKVAWGDLAHTINSPSNQLRQLKNNMKEIGVVAGQLMIPMVTRTLTVLNGLSIAIKRLLVDIAQILGISLNLDDFGSGFSDSLEEDVDALDDFNKTLKETKKGIREFDELKVIGGSKDDSLTGIADEIDLTQQILEATSEYEKVWDEAYEKMKSKAEEIAGLIGKALEPIKKIVEDFAIGDFFSAGQDISKLVASIFNFVADAIAEVDWKAIGKKIGDFFEGIDWKAVFSSIGNLIWNAIQAVFDIWDGSFNVAPFETAIVTALLAMKFTGLGGELTSNVSNAIGNSLKGHNIKARLTQAGLGAISLGLGLALTIDNVKDIKLGKYASTSAQSLIKQAISSLLLGAGATMVAAAIGATGGTLGLVFAVTFAAAAAFNFISAKINEPTPKVQSQITDEQREWAEKLHLDSMEVFTQITANAEVSEVKIANIEFYASKVEELSEKYDELTDAQKAELKYYSDELIKLVPSIADSIDSITGAYVGEKSAIDEMIESQKKAIKLQAYTENLVALEKRRAELQPDYEKLKAEWQAAEEEYRLYQDMLRKEGIDDTTIAKIMMPDINLGQFKLNGYQEAIAWNLKIAFANYTELNNLYKPIENDWKDILDNIEYYSDLFNETTGTKFEETTDAVGDAIKKMEEKTAKTKLPKNIVKTTKEVVKKLEDGEKPTQQEMVDLFRIIDEAFMDLPDGQVPDDIHNLMTAIQVAFIKDTPELLALVQQLGDAINSTFAGALNLDLSDLIPDVKNDATKDLINKLGYIRTGATNNAQVDKSNLISLVYDAFTSVGATSTPKAVVEKINELMGASSNRDILSSLTDLETVLKDEFLKLGYNIDLGWAQGIWKGSTLVYEAIEGVSENGEWVFKDSNDMHSPSKLYRKDAYNIPLGIALGIADGLPKIDTAMEGLTESMTSDFGQLKYNVPKLDIGTNRTSYYGSVTPSREDSFLSQLARVTRDNNGQTEVVFRIEGDPHGMFRVMREQGDVYRRRTGRSAF